MFSCIMHRADLPHEKQNVDLCKTHNYQWKCFLIHETFGEWEEKNFWKLLSSGMEHAVAQWLRHYATSRKVASFRPRKVKECFQFT
jgi:hypothetical protein